MKNRILLASLLLVGVLTSYPTQAQVAGFRQEPLSEYAITSPQRVNLSRVHVAGSSKYLVGDWRDDITFSGWGNASKTYYHQAYSFAKLFFSLSIGDQFYQFISLGVEADEEIFFSDVAVGARYIYLLGSFSGTLWVDPDFGEERKIFSLGNTDAFLIRLNLKGGIESVDRLGSEGRDFGDRLAIGGDGDLLIAGRFSGTTNFLPDPNDNHIDPITSEGSDLFVAKYDPDFGYGSIRDLTILGGPEDQTKVTGLLVDSNNNVYVSGKFTKAVRVREAIFSGTRGEQATTTVGSKQVFFTRLDQDLAPRWLTVLEGAQEFETNGDLDYDPSTQQLLAVQDVSSTPTYHGQTLKTSPQDKDTYVLRVEGNNGNLINHFLIGTTDTEDGKQIVSDGQGNYFVSGTFQSELTISQGGTTRTLTRSGTKNTFLAAFSTSDSQQPDDHLVYLSGFSNNNNLYASRGMTVLNQGSELWVDVPFVFDQEAFGLDGASLRANASGTYDVFLGRYRFPSIPRINEVVPVRTGDRYELGVQGIRLFSSSARDFVYRVGEGTQLLEGQVSGTIDGSDQVYQVALPVPDTWVAGTEYPLALSKSFYTDFYQTTVQIPPVVTPLSADASGTCAETLSLSGRYFGSSSSGVSIAFERDGAEVRSVEASAVAPTELTVPVPAVYPQEYQVRVRVNGQEATAGTFRVLPTITQISSTTALPGGTLTVSGCAFIDATHDTNLLGVSLQQAGQAAVEVSTFTVAPEQPDKLELTLPSTLPVGTYTLAVTVNGQLAAGDFNIKVVDANTTLPLVTALSSDGEASPGETIIITGKNLGTDPDQITVEIGEGQSLPVSSVNESGTEITFVVPADLPEGEYPKVVVKLGGQTALGTLSLRVVPLPEELVLTLGDDNPTVFDATTEALALSSLVSGAGDSDIVQLRITELSGDVSQEVTAQPQGDRYEVILTPDLLTDPLGFEYQFVVSNGANSRGASATMRVYRRYPDQPMTLYKPDRAEPTQADYQLVAVPFRTQDVRDAWTGPPTFNPESIRLLRYAAGSSAYQEFGADFNNLEPGRGYWLVKRAGVPLSVQGTTVAVDTARSFAIPLQAGWNLIGNPFPFEVGTDWLGVLDQRVFRRDRYAEADGTLRAYEGLFVESTTDTVVRVSAVSDRNARTGRSASGISRFSNHPLNDAAWFVGFTLSTPTVTNALAGFGMHPRAQPGYDTYDALPLPRFQRFVEMQIDNALTNKKLERDIVPTAHQHTWRFKVAADPSVPEVRLAWDSQGWGRNDRELWLRDELTQRMINLRKVSDYTFRAGSAPRAFTLFYGPREVLSDVIAPTQVQVGAVYPNPATRSITLPITIPTDLGPTTVRWEVTDITGRRVHYWQDPVAPGVRSLVWNFNEAGQSALPGGLYHYRVVVGDRASTFVGKLIINPF